MAYPPHTWAVLKTDTPGDDSTMSEGIYTDGNGVEWRAVREYKAPGAQFTSQWRARTDRYELSNVDAGGYEIVAMSRGDLTVAIEKFASGRKPRVTVKGWRAAALWAIPVAGLIWVGAKIFGSKRS